MKRQTLSLLAAGLLSAVLAPVSALAQAYPGKPVKVIIPFPPGGTLDAVGRQLAQKLSEQMGQQFVVIRNMPTPGSEAYEKWQDRQNKKAERKGIAPTAEAAIVLPRSSSSAVMPVPLRT